VRHRNRTDLKPDFSVRGWLHVDPGQCESGSTLTTSVDVGRIQEVQWKGTQSVSGLLRLVGRVNSAYAQLNLCDSDIILGIIVIPSRTVPAF